MLELHIDSGLLDEQVGPQAVAVDVLRPEAEILHELEQRVLILHGRVLRPGRLRPRQRLRRVHAPRVEARHSGQVEKPRCEISAAARHAPTKWMKWSNQMKALYRLYTKHLDGVVGREREPVDMPAARCRSIIGPVM